MDAREYLKSKDVPLLMEEGLRALVKDRPDDAAEYLGQYFARAAKGRSKHRGGKKPEMHISVDEESPELMNPSTLAVMLRGESQGYLVLDVRPDTCGGRIRGSKHTQSDTILRDPDAFASEIAHLEAVVFVSLQSPDLDTYTALPVIQSLRKQGSTTRVFTLIDGMKGWVASYADDSALIENFDPVSWSEHTQVVPPITLNVRRGSLKCLHISVPEAPERMSSAALAVMVHDENPGCVVVDVRDDTEGGRVRGSVNIPHHDIIKDPRHYAEQWKDRDAVVFVSVQSPDLDENAAIPVMQQLHDMQSKAGVFILMGGLKGWMQTYRGDKDLIEDFVPTKWGMEADEDGKVGKEGRKRRSLHISVPDAPEKMGMVELSCILRGEISSPRKSSARYVVVDVRPDTRGGRIPGSVHTPCDNFIKDIDSYAEQWHSKGAIIFVSVVSPDLDQTAAVALLNALHERGSDAQVFVLLGGLRGWVNEYGTHDGLFEGYEEAVWKEHAQPPTLSSERKKRRKPEGMQIDIPEEPQRISASELELMIKSGSDSCVVVDVRSETDGGTIPRSLHIPLMEFIADVATHAEQWKNKDSVVFVSEMSPDLDQQASLPFLQELTRIASNTQVCTLIGGLKGWFQTHGNDPALANGYDPARWAPQQLPA
eukprot:Sspe_Gene.63414::Locus_36323_Transcript_1_1_Confidence_1.000_Length_2084::g.63414::m.63414